MTRRSTKWLCAMTAMSLTGTALAAEPQKKAQAPVAPGLMAKVPMKLGYYVNVGDDCSKPSSVMKFGPNSVWDTDESGGMEYKISSVSRDGAWYAVNYAGNWEEQDPSGVMVQPRAGGRLGIQIQDDAELKYCPEAQVPARFKKQPLSCGGSLKMGRDGKCH